MHANPSIRIGQLDGLRAIAILSVFIHHAYHVPLLWMGVDMFFVLSGFLITGILLGLKSNGGSYFGTFYGRRARRILPPYAILMVLATVFFTVKWREIWYWYVFFGANVAKTLGVGGPLAFSPLWSLAVEEQFYLVWPWVVLLSTEKTLKRVGWTAVLVVPLLRAALTGPTQSLHFAIYYLTPFRMDLLCAGSLVGLVWRADRAVFHEGARWRGWALRRHCSALSYSPGSRASGRELTGRCSTLSAIPSA